MNAVQERLSEVLDVVHEAEAAIMEIYDAGTAEVTTKADNTPVTQADIAAHTILSEGLARLFPDIPILSEEGNAEENLEIARTAERFLLVDPIDGTQEFVRRTGHFSIGLALIEGDGPAQGFIAAPTSGMVYWGGPETGSFMRGGATGEPVRMRVRPARGENGVVVQSLSHQDEATDAYVAEHYPDHERRTIGSQMKFIEIAEGRADVYPRLASKLCLWDLAPGHAILEGAGGQVTTIDGGPIDYRNGSLQVGDFIASGGAA